MVDETNNTELDGTENDSADTEQNNDSNTEQQAQAGHKKRNPTREFIDLLKSENAQMRERLSSLEASQNQPQDDFDDMFDADDGQQALTKEQLEQFFTEREQKVQQARKQQQDAELVGNFRQQLASFEAKNPDFQEKVATMNVALPESVQRAIMADPNGAAILYQASEDDNLAEQLAMVNDRYAGNVVKKLSSRMTATPQEQNQNNRSFSNAPAPIEPMSGNAPTSVNEDELSDAEWTAKMQAARHKQ